MFVGKILDASDIVKTLKPISSVITEIALTIDESGWNISACDQVMTTMFQWAFSKDKFSEYSLQEKTLAKVNLQKFLSVLERFSDVSITINQTKIILTDTVKTFIIPQINMEEDEQPKPSIDFTASFTAGVETLSDIMKDVSMVGDLFSIDVSKDKVQIEAKSDTEGSFIANVEAITKTESRVSSSFSADLLKPILNKYFDIAKIDVMQNGPMKITLEQNGIKESLLIAPRIVDSE